MTMHADLQEASVCTGGEVDEGMGEEVSAAATIVASG
jgi:hypothetical protein